MKFFKKIIILITACLVLGACQQDKTSNKQIIVGTSPGPYSQLFLDAVKPILEKQGYQIKQIDFSDLMQADIALQQGSIDVNVDQHTAYMDAFNQNKKANLIALTHIPTVPTAIYSKRHTNLQAIKKGSAIAVPNDPANAARAYRLLAKAGWITLKPSTNPGMISKNDIKTNPYELNITELDPGNIPRTLSDFDYSVIPGSRAYAAKINPDLALLQEDIIPSFELVVAVRADNAPKAWAQAVKSAYSSAEFKQYMQTHNTKNYWYVPKENN
ncbi:MetQ/NlpA family ABC transporter substrate-binding protein [Snodgrassella alvi]|uniref:MetQ/NlpA family ABC transporter substrate-binding protein n=1 Tax=Snodgrassella alvi TaxID=1196083 RepID=UPI00351C9CCE